MASLFGLLIMPFVVLAGVIYFLPSLIAVARAHRRLGTIVLLNLLLGWTFVGWVLALAWALAGSRRRRRVG
jgi:hypothetical protein